MASTSSNIIETAPSTPSSSFSKPQPEYEVFLSFRGADTSNTFTDHLYHALDFYKGIRTFRDDEDLEIGRPNIKPELLDAIETSRMAVIIFSSNYASSSWCLEELAMIVECMKERGMKVLSVFYHLDPSVVRYQIGTFKEAFAKHEERFEEKMVKRWRDALEEVAGLSGRHLKDGQSESKLIEEIVEKISQELNDTTLSGNYKNGLVGIDSRVQEIMDLYMDMASADVRFIGICGMSGIGKTTLAQVVFERVHRQFQTSSFLSDVKRRDLVDSQDQLLQDMKLKKSEKPIRWDVLKGVRAISTRLSNKKVIIVLDDVDEEKLEKLAGCHDWFGPGSRIIITTEDKGLLRRRCGKKNVYNAKKLNASDALQLFSREAFGKPECEKDLLDICNGFVSYVDGNPLALKILGSSMHDISKINLWKAQLERLRVSAELPDDERIQNALRISYTGLSTPKKKLFLDVACFFNGEDKNRIADILEDSGCILEIDIKALIDKSLITILGGKLWMHNLLQQMGWEIVNQEWMKRPEERSRLWLCEDVLEVLNNRKGADSVECILLNASSQKEIRLNNADAFSKMKKLRLLKICTSVHLPDQGLSYLSNELRLMEWHKCPLTFMPTSFQPDKLVELVMHCSQIKQLPNGFSNLGRLKVMDLSDSHNLIKTPNFTGLPNLERVIFKGCTSLYEVHPSIGVLKRLTLLSLEDCKYLNSLPPEINLESLETLILSGCSRLKKFPDIGTSMTRLSKLYLDGTAIEELPLSIKHLTGLTLLNLQDCNLEDGVQLLDDLSCLSSLQGLNLSRNNFRLLPNSISQLSKLKFILLKNCTRLQSLPNLPLSTQFVMARGCTSLENYSNQVWTSGGTGLTLIDCLSSGDDEESQIRDLNLLDVHFQPLWQRYMKEKIEQSERFQCVIPQTEIPKWFSHQKPGSIVPIRLPSDLHENSNWRGIALCTVFVVNKKLNNEDSPGRDSKRFHEFICRLDIDGGVVDSPLVFTFPKDRFYPGSLGLWLYISHEKFREHVDVRGCISPSVTTNSPDVEIKLFGARLLNEGDMEQFVQNLSQERFGSPDDLRQRHQDFIHGHMNYSNDQSDSIPRLKRELKKLLSTLYQGDPARNHWYDYIFPHISIPRWFSSHQNFLSEIRMQLPSDLHNNTRWMGFSVYALYTVYKRPYGSGQDPTIILSFSGLSAGEAPSAPYIALPLSRDIFIGSRRLLGFYIPRVLFGLNQCSEIWASFQSNNPHVLKVETCGIRVVYEQDVEEFVETLVQCMFQCPDYYREFYYKNLFDQVLELQGCDHGKDFSCSFSLQRRPPMPKLLPSIENVAEEGCTSPETFSNQAGSSRNSTSLILGIPLWDEQCGSTSSIGIVQQTLLEHWFKTHSQDYNNGAVFNHCFPQSEIPQWFCRQSDSPSVTIPLPPSLFNNLDWMGFAVCAVFLFHKHPTAILMNLDSGFPHRFMCHSETELGCMRPLLENSISEDEILISLYQRSFIWVLFLPRWMFSHQKWSQSTWAKFSFISDSPDVSVLKCGVGLVDRQNMEEFNRTIVQLITSGVGYLNDVRSSCKGGAVSERLPICVEKKKEGLHISRGNRHPHNRFSETGYRTGPLDLDPSFYYSNCFPPSKVTQEWFSHQSRGHSVTLDIPLNLYNDNNWMGLAVCVCFSIVGGDLETITANWASGVQHFIYFQFRTSIAGLDDFVGNCCTSNYEIVWLMSLGRFIWIAYVPGELFKYMLRPCSRIEASFVSDWPGVTVQKCGLRLLYQHDEVEFLQNLIHCNALNFEHKKSLTQFMDYRDKIIKQNPTVYPCSGCTHFGIFERPTRPGKSDHLLEFDGCSEYNLCFPPREILNWFSHRSNGPSVTIDVPTSLYDDEGWMGLLLCAYFSVHEDQTAISEKPDSAISHKLICSLESNVAGPQLELHVHGTTKEEFRRLYIQDEFHWLSYIPRGSLPDWLNQSSCLEASFLSDWPGLVVQKCGLRFFHVHDEEEFEKIIFRCCFVSENRGFHPSKSESSGAKNQPCKKDFYRCLAYNSCFPPNEILDWFSHRSEEPPVTIPLPTNLYDDRTWMGLALCVSFLVQEHCTIACNLICRLETDIGSLERLHMYCLSKEDLMLLPRGGFLWLSYIPRESFPNWLNQSSFIKASIKTYCRSVVPAFYTRLGLTVQNCGFRLLYQNEEREFKETIRRLSQTRGYHPMKRRLKKKQEDKAGEPSTTSMSDDPRFKDKGKRIVE